MKATGSKSVRHKNELIKGLRHSWQLYILLVPALIWLIAFMYAPMYGLLIALKITRRQRVSWEATLWG